VRPGVKTDVCVGIGIKPVSWSGTTRLVHSAIAYAIKNRRKSVTLVHKGNIMKFTEGAFRDWATRRRRSISATRSIPGRNGRRPNRQEARTRRTPSRRRPWRRGLCS